MKEGIISKLKKKMDQGAKTIALGDKAILAIEKSQEKVVEDFNRIVLGTVKKSEETIKQHENIIKQAEGMKL